jgi:hypothetical protein
MRKQQENYLVRNPHGVVVVVGESEIAGIKRNIEAGLKFEILEKLKSEDSGIKVPEVPVLQGLPYECKICGKDCKRPPELAKHIKKNHKEEWLKTHPPAIPSHLQ